MTPSDRDREMLLLEALFHELGEDAAEQAGSAGHAHVAADARLAAMIDEKLAAIGERRLAEARAGRTARKPIEIRDALRALSREALLARLQALRATFQGALVAQHRHLDTLSDDDLRSLIADLEAVAPASDGEG